MTTINDKVLKAIFGSTAAEAAGELAVLQAKDAAWAAARALAVQAESKAPAGAIIVPVLGYEDEPSAVGVVVANTACGIEAVGVWQFTAAGNLWENPTLSNFTPFEGDWHAWKLAREASAELAARQVEQAAAEAKKQAAEQAALQEQAADQAAESRQKQVRWFAGAYRDAVYALWGEKFVNNEEKDDLLKALDTRGKLRDETEAVLVIRDQIMALCPVPEKAAFDPTEAEVASVADVVASWVNGDLDVAYPFCGR
jgi:hypothetical protein